MTTPPTRADLDTCPDCRMTRNCGHKAICGKHAEALLATVESNPRPVSLRTADLPTRPPYIAPTDFGRHMGEDEERVVESKRTFTPKTAAELFPYTYEVDTEGIDEERQGERLTDEAQEPLGQYVGGTVRYTDWERW
jgi:hypothetical protein